MSQTPLPGGAGQGAPASLPPPASVGAPASKGGPASTGVPPSAWAPVSVEESATLDPASAGAPLWVELHAAQVNIANTNHEPTFPSIGEAYLNGERYLLPGAPGSPAPERRF